MNLVKSNNGKGLLKTVEGDSLTFEIKGGRLEVVDSKGGMAMVTIPDVMQSNGVIHVINAVLLPPA